MDKRKITTLKTRFDAISHIDGAFGIEFWYARELQAELGYTEWRNFTKVIDKAKDSCQTVTRQVANHFVDINKMVSLGSGSERSIPDVKLTRYACYLIAQNGDSKKDEIAFAQSYFALQTRKQELIEDRLNLIRRVAARERRTAACNARSVTSPYEIPTNKIDQHHQQQHRIDDEHFRSKPALLNSCFPIAILHLSDKVNEQMK